MRDAVDCVAAPVSTPRRGRDRIDDVATPSRSDGPTGLDALEAALGVRFTDRVAAAAARSRTGRGARSTSEPASNERLEFLGDSVLGLVVTHYVFEHFPDLPEGQLSEVRAGVVNARVLAEVAAELDLGAHLLLGKGEDAAGGRAKQSILADAFEAVVAAVYLDSGSRDRTRPRAALPRASASPRPSPVPAAATTRPASRSSPRPRALGRPRYVVRDEGPDHAKHFFAGGVLRRRVLRRGRRRIEEAGRAGRGVGRVDAPAGRGGRAGGRRCRSYLRSRSCAATSNGGRRQEDQVGRGHRARARSAGTSNKKEFIDAARGPQDRRRCSGAGKYLVMKLDGTDALVVHLGMSGQLLRAKTAREKAPKHTHVVITFTQGGLLRFVDPRTFGEMFVTQYDEIDQQVDELAHLGLDPLETALSWDLFGRMLAERKTKLKPLLMDQKFIAGHRQRLQRRDPVRGRAQVGPQSDSLSQQEVRRLYRAISETLQDAVKYRGSSLADEQYVDLFGQPGEYQHHHQVYDREGQACPRCRRPIHRARYSNRSTFYCDACQV